MAEVRITYFTDILCVWAWFAELRLAAIARTYGAAVVIEHRFCSVFGDTAGKIAANWGDKGGYDGFAAHLRHAAESFPEIRLHPDLWARVRPASSLSPHILLKAVEVADIGSGRDPAFASAAYAMRRAFFEDGMDIGARRVQLEVVAAAGADVARVTAALESGEAHARLSADYKAAEAAQVQGSPTFVLNAGRQKLYGNVGFRIIDANIQELLKAPNPDLASWC